MSNWIISPGFRVKIKQYLKPPPRKRRFSPFFFLPPRGRPQSIAIGLDNVILLGNVAPAPSHPKSPWNLRLSVGVGVVGMEVIYTVGWQPEIPRPNHRLVCIPKPIVNNGNFNYHSLKLVTVAGFLVAINSTTRGWYKLVRCFFFWMASGGNGGESDHVKILS